MASMAVNSPWHVKKTQTCGFPPPSPHFRGLHTPPDRCKRNLDRGHTAGRARVCIVPMGSSMSKGDKTLRRGLQPLAHHRYAAYRDTEPRIVLGNQSAYRVSFWVVEENTKHNTKKRTKECLERLVISMIHHLDHDNIGDKVLPPEVMSGATEDPQKAPATGTSEAKESNADQEDGADKDDYCSRGDDYDGQGDSDHDDKNIREDGGEKEEDCDYVPFLTRDHRMAPRGGTQPTKIPFPVDCQQIRVFAFFESGRGDGWRLCLNKAYSLGLFRKVFSFIASDADITPCINDPGGR